MKKAIPLLAALCLLLSIAGCSLERSGWKAPVTFFYRRQSSELQAHPEGGVIVPEEREISGRNNDLFYLLSLYLRGPLDDGLVSPFPAGCRLVGINRNGTTLHVILDEHFAALKDMELTTACACLVKTCMSLADVEQVHMEAMAADGKTTVNLVLDGSSLLLDDTVTAPSETVPAD